MAISVVHAAGYVLMALGALGAAIAVVGIAHHLVQRGKQRPWKN